jgi:UDP-N-acetylmuramate--alanine ligase
LALRTQGARIGIGQRAENLDLFAEIPSAVVISTAIKETNPELVAARERGIPVLHRAQALAALMEGHRVACIAGTHGKTSTTSMLTVALQHCRMDPSFAIGGDLNESGANAHHGGGGIFIAEADESDGSFLVYSPFVAVVTNVEPDHLDHHGTPEAYAAVFDSFVERIEPNGVLIICVDDQLAATLADKAERAGVRVRRYGRSVESVSGAADLGPGDSGLNVRVLDYTPRDNGGVVRISWNDGKLDVPVAVPGEHMALNAVAALLAGLELGAPLAGLTEGLSAFGGVRRRFEFKGRAHDVRVYDDYAHHPTEVNAQLVAARHIAGQGRLLVVFQPHLYSRTKIFAEEFARALGLADEVVVLDVYGARESPEPGVTGDLIAQQITGARVHYEPAFDHAATLVANLAQPGDLVITMGAGDVTQLGPDIITELEGRLERPGDSGALGGLGEVD